MKRIIAIFSFLLSAKLISCGQIMDNGNQQILDVSFDQSTNFQQVLEDGNSKFSKAINSPAESISSWAQLLRQNAPISKNLFFPDFTQENQDGAPTNTPEFSNHSSSFQSPLSDKSIQAKSTSPLAVSGPAGKLNQGVTMKEPRAYIFLIVLAALMPLLWLHGRKHRAKE